MAKKIWKPGNMLYPVPAVLVSCQNREGKKNLFTAAWTGTICTNPPMAYVSVRPERYSYGMIRETGAFVINLTTEAMARAVDYCGVKSGCLLYTSVLASDRAGGEMYGEAYGARLYFSQGNAGIKEGLCISLHGLPLLPDCGGQPEECRRKP